MDIGATSKGKGKWKGNNKHKGNHDNKAKGRIIAKERATGTNSTTTNDKVKEQLDKECLTRGKGTKVPTKIRGTSALKSS